MTRKAQKEMQRKNKGEVYSMEPRNTQIFLIILALSGKFL